MSKIKVMDILGYVSKDEMSLEYIEEIFKKAFYLNDNNNIKEKNNTISVVFNCEKVADILTEYQNGAVKELLGEKKQVGFIVKNNCNVVAVVAYLIYS